MNKQLEELRLELMSMKVMIWSLAEVQINNTNKLAKWERECKKVAKQILVEYDESEKTNHE